MADEWEVLPDGAARVLLENAALLEITARLIDDAKDALTRVDPTNAAQVARYQGEVSAVESLLGELETRAAGKATS